MTSSSRSGRCDSGGEGDSPREHDSTETGTDGAFPRSGSAPSRDRTAVDRLLVGRIVAPFGRFGEVKLLAITDYPERLAQYEKLWLRWPDGREEAREVERVRPHKGVMLVKFEGSESIDDAERLRDAEAWIDAQQAQPLPAGHFYLHDIIGLRVFTAEGEEIGAVTEVLRGPANDVYVAGGLLIPATHDAVAEIDLNQRRLIIRSRAFLEGEEA